MSLIGNACVRAGCRISQSLLVVPFIRLPIVTLVALVLLIGSGCTLQPHRAHRGKQALNPKIPAEISIPVAEAASPGESGENVALSEPVTTSESAAPEGGGGAEEASRGETAEGLQGGAGKQGEPPGILTTEPVVAETKEAVSIGAAGGGAVFASLNRPGSLSVASVASTGEKVGGPDPGFSEAAEASEDSLETEEVLSPAPAESPSGAGDLIEAIEAPALLVAQDKEEKPEKSQDEAASSEPAAEEPSEKTGTGGSSAGAGGEAESTEAEPPTDEKPSRFPMGMMWIFGVCLVLAVIQNTVGKKI